MAADSEAAPLVLVVDDFEDMRLMYSEYLAQCGYRVATAADGEEGLRVALSLRPAVVVLDLAMPVMDGWEAARQLRSHPETKRAVIIAVTGNATARNRRLAMEAGCDHFIAKPFLPAALDGFIRRVLARNDEAPVSGR